MRCKNKQLYLLCLILVSGICKFLHCCLILSHLILGLKFKIDKNDNRYKIHEWQMESLIESSPCSEKFLSRHTKKKWLVYHVMCVSGDQTLINHFSVRDNRYCCHKSTKQDSLCWEIIQKIFYPLSICLVPPNFTVFIK